MRFEQAYALAGKQKQNGYYKMQDMTFEICDNVTVPSDESTATLIDVRDNNLYTVAKLEDEKCWMTQNLKIVNKTITSSDSDVSSSFTIPSSSTSRFIVGSEEYTNNSAAYVDSTYGGYYTWYTATAGTGTSSMTTQNQNATGSICPKGWKLPTSGSDTNSSDFGKLVTSYGGNSTYGSRKLRTTPVPGFTDAGYIAYNNGQLSFQGVIGYYWSSTVSSSTSAYILQLDRYPDPACGDLGRVPGRSVRCVAR